MNNNNSCSRNNKISRKSGVVEGLKGNSIKTWTE